MAKKNVVTLDDKIHREVVKTGKRSSCSCTWPLPLNLIGGLVSFGR